MPPKRKLAAGSGASAAASSATPRAKSAAGNAAKRQKRTGAVAQAATADAEAEDVEPEGGAADEQLEVDDAVNDASEPADDMETLVALESAILSDAGANGSASTIAQHYNSLVKIVGIGEAKLRRMLTDAAAVAAAAPPIDDIACGVSAVQAAVRVFTQWFASGEFQLSKAAAKKKKEKNAALQALQGLLATQYKKVWSLLLQMVQSSVIALQSSGLHAAMDLVQAEGSSVAAASSLPASTVSETLLNGSFQPLLRTLLLAGSVAQATRHEFASTFIDQHADLRANVYQQIKSLAHLALPDYTALCKEYGGKAPSPGAQHIVEFLLKSSWQTELTKNWIVLPAADDEDDLMAMPSMGLSTDALKKLYGDAWMGVLKHKMTVEMYKEILVQLHSVIIPAVPQPMLLADFLTDSYNIGGVVSLLALNGLFILISKFNLDYPSFFKKLYSCCKPYVFHAKYRARFFQLVSLFLTSSYLPSYLVCAFTKRFARLSLTAPPAGAIFCIAMIYNLLRRHPVCRPLINRSLATAPNAGQAQPVKKGETKAVTEHIAGPAPTPNGGILSSLANLLAARQAAVASGTLADPLNTAEENTALRLTMPVYQAPSATQSLSLGRDPYLYEAEDPEESNASESSLWEIKSLTEHFSPTVANLAKVFFTTHAPKKDLEMTKYIEQSYDTLFNKEIERRANQRVVIQQQAKFTGLFNDAHLSIGLTFQLPNANTPDAQAAAEMEE